MGPRSSDLGCRLKANAIGAVPALRDVGGPFCWSIPTPGKRLAVKQQSVDMAMNASGIRDTARVLRQPHHRHQGTQKKEPDLHQVHHSVLAYGPPAHVEVEICRADELERRRGLSSELDEMWSYVGQKANQRWLCTPLITTRGKSCRGVWPAPGRLAAPEGVMEPWASPASTPMAGAPMSGISSPSNTPSANSIPKIESKHMNLRTRIKRLGRRTSCFAKTERMHDRSDGLSTGMSSGGSSNMRSTALKHLQHPITR